MNVVAMETSHLNGFVCPPPRVIVFEEFPRLKGVLSKCVVFVVV